MGMATTMTCTPWQQMYTVCTPRAATIKTAKTGGNLLILFSLVLKVSLIVPDVHQNRGTVSGQRTPASYTDCACALENGVHVGAKTAVGSPISAVPQESPPLSGSTRCTLGVHPLHMVHPTDYIPLPAAKDEPCHVCGSRPTSSVLRGGEQYLCYACLKAAKKKPGTVKPLPGLLDHRTFERARVDLGRCTICDAGKAVYRSREAQASICQGCYARLVREWNRGEGVR